MRVFVSYNSRDPEATARLVSDLRTARATVDLRFAPRPDIGGAYRLAATGTELERSDVFLLLLGNQVAPGSASCEVTKTT